MKFFFYLPKESINEATEYYTNLLKKAFKSDEIIASDLPFVTELIDVIVTIRVGDQNAIKLENKEKKYKYINWFQGIGPEEFNLLNNYSIKGKLGKKYLEYYEKKSLVQTDLCIFVSAYMKIYYEKKYKIDIKNYIVIPCYNKHLNEKSFFYKEKYCKPTFVYAGALYGWQCIEETLLVFKAVQIKKTDATLTILTNQKQEAKILIEKHQLRNVFVDFVSLDDLQNELVKYKYGFLLRKDDPINNVATPTKMNSYLAAGIIPIYTDVIRDFETQIKLEEFELKFNLIKDDKNNIVNTILSFDRLEINNDRILKVFYKIFSGYYSDDLYIGNLKNKIFELNGRL